MAGSLPRLIDFHERNKSDRFEIIAFHESGTVKSLEDLDGHLPAIREKHWKGRDLPFPILLDDRGITVKKYGVRAFPTAILIDPDGILVERGHPEMLADMLADKLGLRAAESKPESRR